ncbi:MAG: DUF1800 family protein, partial [Rhodothermales bacterium]|nr:DUF1800 family protein [Rhodothermales bacterium]
MNRRAFLRIDPAAAGPEDPIAHWARQAPPLLRVAPERERGLVHRLLRAAPPTPPAAAKNGTAGPRPLGIAAGLTPYAAPLDRRHAVHLLRRTGFDAAPAEVDALLGMEAGDAVDALVDAALVPPVPMPPDWVDEGVPRSQDAQQTYFMDRNPEWLMEYYATLMRQLYYGGLREKMTLFWHNHFVTEIDAYLIAPYAYRYVETLRTHALGNFKDFVHAIGIDSAMLLYLNGVQNAAGAPNENYARELLELFTMGPEDDQGTPNYTQQDIEEIARALTGWLVDPFNLTVQLVSVRHDGGEKTIFGRTEAFGYDDVIDLLFEERPEQIAAFLCRKLYRAFIYEAPDEALVAELAQVMRAHDFAIAP